MFEISAKNIQEAKTYLPLAQKIKIAGEIAQNCVTRIGYNVKVGNVPVDLPDWTGRNPALKERYLLGALLKLYFGFRFTPVEGTEFLLSQDDYDRAASQHPRNAIERCKGSKEARDAAFDLLEDYKRLCEMVKVAVDDTAAAQNDPVARFMAAQMMAMTPEALQQLSTAEAEIQKQIASMKQTGDAAKEAIKAEKERMSAEMAMPISEADKTEGKA